MIEFIKQEDVVKRFKEDAYKNRLQRKYKAFSTPKDPYNDPSVPLYDSNKTILYRYGGYKTKYVGNDQIRPRYVAPSTLKYIKPGAFKDVESRRIPAKIVLPPCMEELDVDALPSVSEIDFQGQLKDVVEGAFSHFGDNLTIKISGLFSEINPEGREGLKKWYNGNISKRELVLKAPEPMGGKCEDGVITLTKVLRLDEKLAMGCDSRPAHFCVNATKELSFDTGLGVPILVDTVVIGGENTYLPGVYSPLYSEVEATRIRFVSRTENPEKILELLVHEPEDEVVKLLKNVYKS